MPEKKNEILQERDEKLALKTLAETEGGKAIIASLRSDIVRHVERLSTEYRTGSHFELVRTCADLSATLSLYRALTRADGHVKELDEIIKETFSTES